MAARPDPDPRIHDQNRLTLGIVLGRFQGDVARRVVVPRYLPANPVVAQQHGQHI